MESYCLWVVYLLCLRILAFLVVHTFSVFSYFCVADKQLSSYFSFVFKDLCLLTYFYYLLFSDKQCQVSNWLSKWKKKLGIPRLKSDKEIATFLKVLKDLEAWRGSNCSTLRKTYAKGLSTKKISNFVLIVQKIINKSPGNSVRINANDWKVVRVQHQKSYEWRHPAKVVYPCEEERELFDPCKELAKQDKTPRAGKSFDFPSMRKSLISTKRKNRRKNSWLWRDPTEVPGVRLINFAATVLVLGVTINDGDIILAQFLT